MPRLEDYSFGRVVVDVEVLRTADAVRRYGELDERRTAAALHLTR